MRRARLGGEGAASQGSRTQRRLPALISLLYSRLLVVCAVGGELRSALWHGIKNLRGWRQASARAVRGARCGCGCGCAAGVKTVRRQRGPATPPSACAHLNCHLLPALSLFYLLSAPRESQRLHTPQHQRGCCWPAAAADSRGGRDRRERERARAPGRELREKRRKGGPGRGVQSPNRIWACPCRALPPPEYGRLAGMECAGASLEYPQGLPHDDGGVLQNSVLHACLYLDQPDPPSPSCWSMQYYYSHLESHLHTNPRKQINVREILSPFSRGTEKFQRENSCFSACSTDHGQNKSFVCLRRLTRRPTPSLPPTPPAPPDRARGSAHARRTRPRSPPWPGQDRETRELLLLPSLRATGQLLSIPLARCARPARRAGAEPDTATTTPTSCLSVDIYLSSRSTGRLDGSRSTPCLHPWSTRSSLPLPCSLWSGVQVVATSAARLAAARPGPALHEAACVAVSSRRLVYSPKPQGSSAVTEHHRLRIGPLAGALNKRRGRRCVSDLCVW